MSTLSLQQLFGANVIQSSDYLIINKQDFINLSTANSNTGESLLLAIILKAWSNFDGKLTDSDNNPITNEQGIAITYDNSALYELLNIFYWKRQLLLIKAQPKIVDTFVVETNAIP